MSDSALGIRTAQEYIEEYGLLKECDSDDKLLSINPKTGEVTGWDTAKNCQNELSAAMKQIYTAGTGNARSDMATMRNAFETTAKLFDIAISKLDSQDDIELEHVSENAIRQAEELSHRCIDLRKRCQEYCNEFEAMLEFLKHYLNELLSQYKGKHPALCVVEKKIGRSLVVPIFKKDFAVFEQIDDDLHETNTVMAGTEERVGRIKELTTKALVKDGKDVQMPPVEESNLILEALMQVLRYELEGGSKEKLIEAQASLKRYLANTN